MKIESLCVQRFIEELVVQRYLYLTRTFSENRVWYWYIVDKLVNTPHSRTDNALKYEIKH